MQETQKRQEHRANDRHTRTPWWSPRDLTPGYFALVMASGIVSIACFLLDYRVMSTGLAIIAAGAYILLIVLNVWRFFAHRDATAADFADVQRSFGFLTFVAGTGVLGTRLAFSGWWTTASILLGVAGVSWLALGYVIPVVAVLGKSERPITKAANGLWFVLIVGA